ncbi:MAG: phosphoribosylformylglycinamidine synthase [Bacillota bacterium]|nr:MAG: phosphoribosylformylglycinamidine synthase [Bacillota bacterium]
MKTFRAVVDVELKPGTLDPQGHALAGVLRDLGFGGVGDVRVGKRIRLDVLAPSAGEACRQVEAMCRRVLANPVLETFRYRVEEAAPPPDESAGDGETGGDGGTAGARAARG